MCDQRRKLSVSLNVQLCMRRGDSEKFQIMQVIDIIRLTLIEKFICVSIKRTM